jgi:hypothetical protein
MLGTVTNAATTFALEPFDQLINGDTLEEASKFLAHESIKTLRNHGRDCAAPF